MASCANGHQNPDGNRFCQDCGLLITATTTQPPDPFAAPGAAVAGGLPAQPSGSKRPAWLIPVIAVVAVVAVLLVVFTVGRSTPTESVTVEFSVFDDFNGCDFGFGYSDVPGSNVIIEADGEIVASGSLPRFGDSDVLSCTFVTTLSDVPADKSFYELTVGRRGTVTRSLAEMESAGWTWDVSLGL